MTPAGISLIYWAADFHKIYENAISLKPLLLCQIELKLAPRFRSYKERTDRQYDGKSIVSLGNLAKNTKP